MKNSPDYNNAAFERYGKPETDACNWFAADASKELFYC